MSDSELLARVAGGEKAAFHRFVRRHQAAVFRYLRALVRNEADAEDVLQQTFLAAFRGAAEARVEKTARAWLFTIGRHAAIRHGRLRAGEPSRHDSIDALGEEAGFADEAGTPEAEAARLEERALLERALESLSSEDREILVLRELEGLRGEEAAEVLGLGLDATKSRLHRARLRFQAAFRREVRDEG
ncbi:MAG: sigma-70 family RNA polymerase sigma factor [Polyangiales bacterium]